MPRGYRVVITASAERDIEAIFDYITVENPTAANDWIEEIGRQVKSLERFPKRGMVIPESRGLGREYRQLVYGHYRTIFRVEETSVIVVRVIHGAQLLGMGVLERES